MLGIQVRFYVAFVVIGLHALLVGCTGVALDESVPFTIAAEGQPSGGRNNEPVTVAIRGDDPNRKVPYGLPDTAQTALKEILSKPDSALYVVVFDGSAGSTGFQVVIDAIVRRRSASGDSLIVRYHVSGPGPGQGGMTVMTYLRTDSGPACRFVCLVADRSSRRFWYYESRNL